MTEILMKAGSFVAIIIMGYMLRRKGFFKEEDFYVLSRIVLKITLPAAIVTNFTGIDLKPSMLLMSMLGLGAQTVVLQSGAGRHAEISFSVFSIWGKFYGHSKIQ